MQPHEHMTKGSTVRGVVDVLRREGLLARVSAALPLASRALLEQPPPSSSWVRSLEVNPIFVELFAIGGEQLCRTVMRDGSRLAQIPVMETFLRGIFRLFGTNPIELYRRTPSSIELTNRGLELKFFELGKTSCRIRARHRDWPDAPVATFHAMAGGFEIPLLLCERLGTVGAPVLVPSNDGATADFLIAWK